MIHYHLRKSHIITPINRRHDNVAGGDPRTPLGGDRMEPPSLFTARGQLTACSLAGAVSCPPAPLRAADEAARMGGERSRQEGL